MDPVSNPYAPGAGQRPPELAGRDAELAAFEVLLERVTRGRPERSVILVGLRGVGKTVLLNALRSAAVHRGWGTGKLEARPDQSIRRPLAAALHLALRELAGRNDAETREILGVVKSFAQVDTGLPGRRTAGRAAAARTTWQPGLDVPAAPGRADSGDIETDLVELFTDVAGLAGASGRGIALFVDEMQDLGAPDVSAVCAACHEISQHGLPLVLVGAGLPHLPTVLSAAKSYSERLFRYARIDRLDRSAADLALRAPAREEGADYTDDALAAMYAATGGYPYFVQAYGKAVWDAAPSSPITAADVDVATPEAAEQLAVGFFGARYERATPAEREYLRAMADIGESTGADAPAPSVSSRSSDTPDTPDTPAATASVSTAAVAARIGRPAQSLSPARDGLLKKGLVYSGQRGRIAFTVPHFGRYLRDVDS